MADLCDGIPERRSHRIGDIDQAGAYALFLSEALDSRHSLGREDRELSKSWRQCRRLSKQVVLSADVAFERGHEVLSQIVDRRV